ncbi:MULTISPECIES: flagellin [Halobacteriovorax]|uniref:Flagellin n=1 Tax=Halobacteriovorax vibrionivorans TaxID=2152716 RepID=A0ABY0IJQ5_9BACT|nr:MULTISPECIES: flagellin [Halobacteriovorax]AYF43132.1 putative flagellin protein [Halobacteriovorax sp. BALOs_7]RZF23153.1 flagellin FliC [Halobacteriovorax vibrionivorans]TGD45939.1 flagellin FliC [Halobacteriovorax sp. Y22]
MGLRIATNTAAQTVQKNIKQTGKASTEALEKLSSGKRINKSADDAAGLAIAKNMEAQVKGLRQASRNANDGISMVQTAEGAMNETSNILVRLRELSVQAASDTIGDTERGFLDKEYQQLVEEVDRIAESTKFGSISLLNGSGSEMDIQVGTFAGESGQIQYDPSQTNATASALNISGLSVSSKDDARSSMENVDEAITSLSEQRANLGAIQSRLQSSVNNLEIQSTNLDASRSVIEDADVAYESSQLASANISKQAGVSSLVQANNLNSQALRLVG